MTEDLCQFRGYGIVPGYLRFNRRRKHPRRCLQPRSFFGHDELTDGRLLFPISGHRFVPPKAKPTAG